jgi:Leucine Rich repeat
MSLATQIRRRLRLSVGMMMILILGFALWLGWRIDRARFQKATVAEVKEYGGWVHYDYEFVNGKVTAGQEPRAPRWLRDAIGDEFFQEIRSVSFVYDDSTGKRYDLDNDKPCDDVLEMLGQHHGITTILMKGHQATDLGLRHLKGLANLEDLYIWDSYDISDEGLKQLENLVELKNLHIDKSRVTDKGFLRLARMKQMDHLVLAHHCFTDDGLAAIVEMRSLRWLDIGGTLEAPSKITDEGMAMVSQLKNLQLLGIGYSGVTDRGLEEIGKLDQLTDLDLTGCRISDDGLQHIAGLKNLKWLHLGETDVTEQGLKHLEGLRKLSLVQLPQGRVSTQAKAQIQSKMPALVNIW